MGGLKITAKTDNSDEVYKGYRISFGNTHPAEGKFFAFGYKSDMKGFPADGSFGDVIVPFDEFSDYWDDATGDAIVTCHENKKYCPNLKTLMNMKTISIWAEG